MKYQVFENYDEISCHAANLVLAAIQQKRSLLVGAATGSTPLGLYHRLGAEYRTNPDLFSKLRLLKLDEWYGLPMNDPDTCEQYLQKHVVHPLHIPADRYFTFNSEAKDPEAECVQLRDVLGQQGPIDLCLVGIGMNGHIAFNEPGSHLNPGPHVANLTRSSQFHPMVADHPKKPVRGLTVGMSDIFHSKMILLLISGTAKRDIVQSLFSQEITTALPASLLWLHPNAICLIDRDAYGS